MKAVFLIFGFAYLLMTISDALPDDDTKKEVPPEGVKPTTPVKQWTRTREDATHEALAAKQLQPLTWTQLAAKLNCSPTWLVSVVMGQSSADEKRAMELEQLLHLPSGAGVALTWPPLKAQYDSRTEFQDPLIYRLHEIALVYGTSIKAMIHELFGDGIMSAIDFQVDVTRVGDRVHILLDGKFLAYRRW